MDGLIQDEGAINDSVAALTNSGAVQTSQYAGRVAMLIGQSDFYLHQDLLEWQDIFSKDLIGEYNKPTTDSFNHYTEAANELNQMMNAPPPITLCAER